MNQVDNISDDFSQIMSITLEDRSVIVLEFNYRPMIQRWTVNLTHGDFVLNGLNISVHPNMVRNYRNVIPFGIACTTLDGVDPIRSDDFSTGRASIYILTASEVGQIEADVVAPI